MLTRSALLLVFWLCGLPCLALPAQAALLLTDADAGPLAPHLRYLRDDHGQLTLAEVQARQAELQPVPENMGLGYTRGAIWLHLVLETRLHGPQQRVLEFEYAYLDDIRLYVQTDDGLEMMRSGRLIPAAERPLASRRAAFPLALPAQGVLTVWIRIENDAVMALPLQLLSEREFTLQNGRSLLFLSLYFGMLLALGLYNLLLYTGLRQRVFLLYSAFVLVFGAAAASMNGIWPLLLPEYAGWDRRLVPVGFTLATTLALLFARAFLSMQQQAPGWHRFLTGLVPLWAVGCLLTLVADIPTAIRIMSLQGILTTLALLVVGVAAVRRQVPAARVFVAAWTVLLLGTALLGLRNAGVLPTSFLTVYSMQMGSALEMLLLSFGLAARFNDLKRRQQAMQTELVSLLLEQEKMLEEKVVERTALLEDARRQLEQQVILDPLTGLYNRLGLRQYFAGIIRRGRRDQAPVAVMLIDLDEFKPVNDRFGHEAGDLLLQTVGQRMQNTLREGDVLGRLGGDEFVVLVEQAPAAAELQQLGERLLQAIRQPVLIGAQQSVTVQASIGICYALASRTSLKTLLRCADAAMYRIKHRGKNGVAMASPDELSSR